MRKVAALLLLLPILSACRSSGPPTLVPTLVDFQTDPQILRGQWSGQIALGSDRPTALTLDLNASDPTVYSYVVTGTGTLGNQSFEVQGRVYALFNQKFIRPQTSPPPQGVQLRLVAGQQVSAIFCPQVQVVNGQPIWKCGYSGTTGYNGFDLQRGNP